MPELCDSVAATGRGSGCWAGLSSLPVVTTEAWMRFIYSGLCVAVCAVAVDCAGEHIDHLTATAAPPFHLPLDVATFGTG